MITRIVKMIFQEQETERFLSVFNANKEKIRNVNGCNYLELLQDHHFKNIFYTYSFWDSQEDLDNYRDSELFKTVWGQTKPLFKEKPSAFSANSIFKLP